MMSDSPFSLNAMAVSDEGDGFGRPRKRRRLPNPDQSGLEQDPFGIPDPLADMELYALSDSFDGNFSKKYSNATWSDLLQPIPTSYASIFDSSTAVWPVTDNSLPASVSRDWFSLLNDYNIDAVLPNRSTRTVPIYLPNPFSDNAHNRISSINPAITFAPNNGEVNGYVKFKMLTPNALHAEDPPQLPLRYQFAQDVQRQRNDKQQAGKPELQNSIGQILQIGKQTSVVRMPPNFGLGYKLRPVEQKIFRFYLDAFCSGRTILPKSNSWKVDLGPMLPASETVRNALLALASTYLLGYSPDDKLRVLANRYYHEAVVGLTKRMQDATQWQVGKGDDIIATFALLNLHDAVTWECRRPLNEVPRWLDGARTASKFLDVTDPGYRYYKPGNVQASSARIGNMMNIARLAIFALPFTPLDISNTSERKFGWLLYGTSASVHKIHGTSGYSPKLLHIWAQITHLAAKFAIEPDRHVIPTLATVIFDRLERLVQWSDLSNGYSSTKSLLEACVLNTDGLIEEPWEMVALGAECWKLAAQVYLLCRLSRYPRTHPKVLAKVTELSECLKRIPCGGTLFTSMTPLLPCFLLGVVSVEDRHRNTARDWFLGVMKLNPCRSCVPPAWEMMKRIWLWMETESIDPTGSVPEMIENRDPWWEKVVTRMMTTEGTTCVH